MRIISGIVPGIGATSLSVVLLVGCGKPQVEVYTIPPMTPRLKAPDHWREVDASPMLEAEKQRFEIEVVLKDRNATALATLTVLPGKGEMSSEDYLRMNVNRWRGQLGLESLQEEARLQEHMQPVKGLPEEARMVDLNGTQVRSPYLPTRTVGVLIPWANALWVYKLSGNPDVVDQEREQFIKLLPEWR